MVHRPPRPRLTGLVLLSLCIPWHGAAAAERVQSRASVTLVQSAAVTVVNNVPLQTVLLTISIAPVGVVFSAPAATPAGASVAGGGPPAEGGAAFDRTGGSPDGEGGSGGLIVLGGAPGGPTIAGDAVSVSVGNASGGTATGSPTVAVVIAQYN